MRKARKNEDEMQMWESRYQKGDMGWDRGEPAPPLVSLLKANPPWLRTGSLINLGCGIGHEARLFGQNGFEVIGVDFAPTAIKLASAQKFRGKGSTNYINSDIFKLKDKGLGKFNYVLEHTCFCALPRNRIVEYVSTAWNLLKQGGILFGLFYRFAPPDDEGPPFYISKNDFQQLFSPFFEIIKFSIPKKSFESRQNKERLVVLKAKPRHGKT